MISSIIAQNQFSLTQNMMHQPFINDAAMGSYNKINGAFIYRDQWVGLDGSPKTFALNVNSPIQFNSKSHIGFTVLR